MRFAATLILGTVLAMPAMAQTGMTTGTTSTGNPTGVAAGEHHGAAPMRHHRPRHMMNQNRSGEMVQDDQGRSSPGRDVNAAYMGGGAILEGQPGGPPPPPSAVLSLPPNSPLPPPQGQMPMNGMPMQQPMAPMAR